jgi:hypothetical protein
VQNSVTDFAQVRHDPEVFKSGKQMLVVMPVLFRDHPAFIKDLAIMITIYSEIFKKLEFLSLEAMKKTNLVSRMIHQVTIFGNTKQYKHFVRKGLPEFLIKWCFTVNKKQTKFIKIKKYRADKILNSFTIDELLKIFMYLFAFNYDAVKKNIWDLLQKILPMGSIQNRADTMSSGTIKKTLAEVLPRFSIAPFSKSDLKRIEQQSIRR